MQTAPLGPETFCPPAHLVRVMRIAPPDHCVSVSSLSPELAWDKSFTGAQGRVPEQQQPVVPCSVECPQWSPEVPKVKITCVMSCLSHVFKVCPFFCNKNFHLNILLF